eukprot:jgi/Chrzof1/7018/Cz02g07240.t1
MHSAWWPPWAAKPFDIHALVAKAKDLVQLVLLPRAVCYHEVGDFQGTPLELSYWISHNLPLEPRLRQRLLESQHTAERLRRIIALLQGLDRLVCVSCGAVLAATENVLKMTQEGVGGIFVNPHGHVHEMVTFKRVRPEAVSYHGHPVSEHSWFPGYAWTICECMRCARHLGWRFTATDPHLRPATFWGLTRSALTCTDVAQSVVLDLVQEEPGEED